MKTFAQKTKKPAPKALSLLLAAIFCISAFASCAPADESGDEPPVEKIPHGTELAAETTPEPEAQTAQTLGISFANGLGTAADELYFSAADSKNWGDPAANAVPAGGDARVLLESAPSGLYDIGVFSADCVNYDAFGVHLSEGDSVALAGDWESGMFTVLHKNGSRDFYTAKVYWSTPDETAERIVLHTQSTAVSVADEDGNAVGTVRYCRIELDAGAAAGMPELAAAIEELNSSRLEALSELLRRNAVEGGNGMTSVSETVSIRRSDSIAVSLLYEATVGNAEFPVCTGVNIDPASGALLTPADILTDVQKLPHLMNLRLSAIGSELEINEYRDHVNDFSKQKADYAFVLEGNTVLIVFNVNAFSSGIGEPVRITLGTEDDRYLIKPRYLILP